MNLQELSIDSLELGPLAAYELAHLEEDRGLETLSDLMSLAPVDFSPAAARDLQAELEFLGIDWGGNLPPPELPKNGIPCWRVRYEAIVSLEPISRIGGQPTHWLDDETWPCCGGCGMPMIFLLQMVSSQEAPLDLGSSVGLQVFVCVGGTCRMCEPLSGANAVVLRRVLRNTAFESVIQNARPARIRLEAWADDSRLETEPDDSDWDATAAIMLASGDKMGGVPIDLELEKVRCPHCQRPMEFLARFGGRAVAAALQSVGLNEDPIVISICRKCEEAAFQQVRRG